MYTLILPFNDLELKISFNKPNIFGLIWLK